MNYEKYRYHEHFQDKSISILSFYFEDVSSTPKQTFN